MYMQPQNTNTCDKFRDTLGEVWTTIARFLLRMLTRCYVSTSKSLFFVNQEASFSIHSAP